MTLNPDLLDDQAFDLEKPLDEAVNVVPTRYFNENSIYYKGLFGMIVCLIPAAFLGLILVKMSLEQSKKARAMFKAHPENYLESSIKRVNIGRIMAYIGLGLFILEIVALMAYMSVN